MNVLPAASVGSIPLYCPSAAPDGWHAVRAPGGYEWWYFDAEDPATDTQIVAIFLQGFVFHPQYLRRYWRYRRFPTRIAPPVAMDYPCVYFVIYRGGRIWRQFMAQYGPGEFRAAADRPDVRIGPNHLGGDGSALQLDLQGTPWALSARGPVLLAGQSLEARLAFTPLLPHPPHERPFFSRRLAGADHHWVIANPLCRAQGEIRCDGQTLAFTGRGYHDHNYGAGPIGPGLKHWFWGRVLLEDRALTFHYAQARASGVPPEMHLVQADANGSTELPAAGTEVDWSGWSWLGLRYPKTARFGAALRLNHPRLIDSAPFYMRLMYDTELRGAAGRAFCEVAYPHRLRWPVLGRMIELSIHRPGAKHLK